MISLAIVKKILAVNQNFQKSLADENKEFRRLKFFI